MISAFCGTTWRITIIARFVSRIPGVLVAAALLPIVSSTGLADSILGGAVVVKPTGNAVIVWDCSAVVARIVENKEPDSDANTELESDAAKVLANVLPELDSSMTAATVRIVYKMTGAVSPAYGNAALAGVEHYAELSITKVAPKNRSLLAEKLNSRALPSWVAFSVTGKLPPR
jgi:hypothetical protein